MALGVIFITLLMLIPLPVIAVDIFIGLNLLCTIIILFTALMVKKTTDFYFFPSLLLISTGITLAISISACRTILSKGVDFDGWLICTVSNLIAGSGKTEQLWIDFIAFVIFAAAVRIIVVKGAARTAEVAARFTLDAMPGRQMSIDSDLASNLINEEEAKKRREEIIEDADFYGAMDGASKLVSLCANINIIIIAIIIAGGTAIDYLYHNIPLIDALKTYIHLSIGSGILFFLPVLIISTAIGTAVPRSIVRIYLNKLQ